jgi:hypothetical protein
MFGVEEMNNIEAARTKTLIRSELGAQVADLVPGHPAATNPASKPSSERR